MALQAKARRGGESSRRTPEEAAGGCVRSSRRKPEEAAERYRSIGAEHCGEHRSGDGVTRSEEYDDGRSARGAQAWHGEETEGAQRHGDLPTATRRSRRAKQQGDGEVGEQRSIAGGGGGWSRRQARQAGPRATALQLASACMGQTWPHMHAHAAARDTARAQGACPAIAAGGAERHNTR